MDETNINNLDGQQPNPRHSHWYIYLLGVLILAAIVYFVWQNRSGEPRSDAPQQSLPLRDGKIPEHLLGAPLESEQQKVTDFGDKLPEGLPADLPIDPKPVKVLQSFVAISPNPPPEEGKQITYSYLTKQKTADIFDSFKRYLVEKNFSIDDQELKGESGVIHASKPDDPNYFFSFSVARETETENVVTISILTK